MTKPREVDIIDLSEFIIAYTRVTGGQITQLKLQKLLYYSQAWHLVHFDKNFLFVDAPEAWVNGPVYERVYRQYAGAKDAPLRLLEGFADDIFESKLEKLGLTSTQLDLMNSVLKKYSQLSDEKLVFLTHCEEPWIEARGKLSPFARSNAKISFDTMHKYYSSKIK